MLEMVLPWVADALVLLGLAILTLSLWGVLRMPDLYTSLHAASKSVVFGLAPLLIAAGIDNRAVLLRGLLVLLFLVLTAPVSSHAIARAYWRYHDRPRQPTEAAPSAVQTSNPGEAAGSE